MSHFAGYLKRVAAGTSGHSSQELEGQRRVLTALSGDARLKTHVAGGNCLWLATLTVPNFSDSINLELKGQGIGVVAGDPIFVDEHDFPTPEQSISAVFKSLLNQQISQLSNTRGMFCAMVWSAQEKRLILATDKLSNRCLYFRETKQSIQFSSSLRLLRLLGDGAENVDEQGLAEQLFFGQPLAERTVFANIKVLGPGQAMVHQCGQPSQILTYSDYTLTPRASASTTLAESQLHHIFSNAVRRRTSGPRQEAFLSGGMDSRAVVAELVDQSQIIRTFCAAYPESIDDIVSEAVAKALGSEHTIWHRSPAERVLVALDPFAIYANENFPSPEGKIARNIWSGDGGSVTLGHVYMTAQTVNLAGRRPTMDLMFDLFPTLKSRPTRQISARRIREFSERAAAGAMAEIVRCGAAEPDRRLFHFYMRNDQARHLHHHFESIGISRIELLTPFFDSDLIGLISSLPTDYFLRHKLYNSWISGFKCAAGDIYWQPYRGHIDCPHNSPAKTGDQWDQAWYSGEDVRRAYTMLARQLCDRQDKIPKAYTSKTILKACMLMNSAGISKYNYEISHARNIIHNLGEAT